MLKRTAGSIMLQARTVCALFIALTIIAACDRLPLTAADEPGGPYLVLELDMASLRGQQLENVVDQMATGLREAIPAIRYSGRGVLNDAARVRLADPADRDRALAALQGLANSPTHDGPILAFSVTDDNVIEARLTPSYLRGLSEQAAEQSIQVLRRRVDPEGRDGVEVARQGETRIFLRAPRVTDTNQLRQRVGIAGLLTFHIVREVSLEDAASGILPGGTILAQPYPGIGDRAEVVERRPRLTGEHLTRANPSVDQYTQEFVLAFELDSEGTRIFCRITREYTGQRFALLLDGQVLTAPTINEPICGGTGQISGNFTPESANELAVILNSGALPAPLTVVEEGVLPRG
jgi:preprotein translocase subunit SecD